MSMQVNCGLSHDFNPEHPIKDIKDAEFNPETRIEEDDLKSLKDSIEKLGIIQPVNIDRTGKLIDGHRRVACAKLLKWKTVPAITTNGRADADAYSLYGPANDQRKNLQGSQSIEVHRAGGPVPSGASAKVIDKAEARFGDSILRELETADLGIRVYTVADRFSKYHSRGLVISKKKALSESQLDSTVLKTMRCIINGVVTSSRVEDAMRDGIPSIEVWNAIKANKPFTINHPKPTLEV